DARFFVVGRDQDRHGHLEVLLQEVLQRDLRRLPRIHGHGSETEVSEQRIEQVEHREVEEHEELGRDVDPHPRAHAVSERPLPNCGALMPASSRTWAAMSPAKTSGCLFAAAQSVPIPFGPSFNSDSAEARRTHHELSPIEPWRTGTATSGGR